PIHGGCRTMTDDNNNEQNPFEQIFGMLFGANGPGSGQGDDKNESGMPQGFQIDPSMMATIMNQMQGLFGQGADPQAQAVSIAQKAVPTPDPAVTEEAKRATTDAFRLAELWLAEATELSVANRTARPLRRADWVQAAMPSVRCPKACSPAPRWAFPFCLTTPPCSSRPTWMPSPPISTSTPLRSASTSPPRSWPTSRCSNGRRGSAPRSRPC